MLTTFFPAFYAFKITPLFTKDPQEGTIPYYIFDKILDDNSVYTRECSEQTIVGKALREDK